MTVISQYVLHAEMMENWGYESLLEQMLFLGTPGMQELTMIEQLGIQNYLALQVEEEKS